MTQEQQDKLLALLLAVAMDGGTSKEDMQKAVKKFLATLPEEDLVKAATTPVEF